MMETRSLLNVIKSRFREWRQMRIIIWALLLELTEAIQVDHQHHQSCYSQREVPHHRPRHLFVLIVLPNNNNFVETRDRSQKKYKYLVLFSFSSLFLSLYPIQMLATADASLTAEKVAHYLPLSGQIPEIQGRIINVTHQIPYNILRSHHQQQQDQLPISPPRSPHASNKDTGKEDCTADPVSAAPISKLARHHKRGVTLRMKFHAADWTVVERRGHQALYAGIQSLRKDNETLHIGWTGPIREQGTRNKIATDTLATEDKVKLQSLLWETGHIVPIFLDQKKSHGHYEGYCKQGTWIIF